MEIGVQKPLRRFINLSYLLLRYQRLVCRISVTANVREIALDIESFLSITHATCSNEKLVTFEKWNFHESFSQHIFLLYSTMQYYIQHIVRTQRCPNKDNSGRKYINVSEFEKRGITETFRCNCAAIVIDPLGRPTITSSSKHTCHPSVHLSVRLLVLKSRRTKQISNDIVLISTGSG